MSEAQRPRSGIGLAHLARLKRWLSTVIMAGAAALAVSAAPASAQTAPAGAKKPNIVIIWGDDIGQSDISAYSWA